MNVAYVTRSVDAAFDLLLRRERAWDRFDLTVEGFYRSFAALLLVLPLNLLTDVIASRMRAAESVAAGKAPPETTYAFADAAFSTLALCAQWLIFPLTMLFVLRFLALANRYTVLVIANNWGTVAVYLLNMPALLLYAAGLVPRDLAIDLNLLVLMFTLYYRYYIAKGALGCHWSVAAGVAVLDLVLQLYFVLSLTWAAGLWLPSSA